MSNRKYVDINNLETVYSSSDEAETTVCVGKNDKVITICSSDNTMITKIKRAALKNIGNWKCWEGSRSSDGKLHSYFFEAPKKALSFRGGNKKEMTEEARQAVRERFAGYVKGGNKRKKEVEA